MRDYITLGSAPPEEPCAQVGSDDYHDAARAECMLYIRLIRDVMGEEPDTARLAIKSFPHDFGSYLEVVCYYEDEVGAEYAYSCESDGPANWGP